jgi:hypothetical protein
MSGLRRPVAAAEPGKRAEPKPGLGSTLSRLQPLDRLAFTGLELGGSNGVWS